MIFLQSHPRLLNGFRYLDFVQINGNVQSRQQGW